MFSFPPSQPPDFRSSNIYAAAAAAAAASADRRDPPTHHHRNWGSSAGGGSTHSGDDESDGDDVDDEEDEDDDVDDDEGGDGDETANNNNSSDININNHKNKINSGNETVNNAGTTNPEKMGNGKAKHSFGKFSVISVMFYLVLKFRNFIDFFKKLLLESGRELQGVGSEGRREWSGARGERE